MPSAPSANTPPSSTANLFLCPPDWRQPAEWTFARLAHPPGPLDGYYPRFQGPWQQGLSLWTQDYPRADRALANAVRRITRVDARSVEQSVSLDDGDEIYNWPFLYAVQVGEWGLTTAEAAKLRDYLLRGGFFMADDCHGTEEQAYFEKTMKMVFPERELVDIPNDDPIFHTIFDLDDRIQVPGAEHLAAGHKKDGIVPHWKAIYDDHHSHRGGRLLPQLRPRRFLGVPRRSPLPRPLLRHGHKNRRQLRHLRHDSLKPRCNKKEQAHPHLPRAPLPTAVILTRKSQNLGQ